MTLPERRPGWRDNPWLISSVVAMAAFMEVLDISIANVALRHIAGDFSAGVAPWDATEKLGDLILRADRALYTAKAAGGGATEVAAPQLRPVRSGDEAGDRPRRQRPAA